MQANSRINDSIQQIGYKNHNDKCHRIKDGCAQDNRIIIRINRFNKLLANAWDDKNLLDNERTSDDWCCHRNYDCYNRYERIPYRMLYNNCILFKPFRFSKNDIIRLLNFNHLRSIDTDNIFLYTDNNSSFHEL